jgi:hypothetical protein|tara:strand:+ start:251 stop:370 length:120 start_codon:yes stop_codon:yes gene_type:complete
MKNIQEQIILPVYYNIVNGVVQYDVEQMTEDFNNAIREL